MLNSANDECLVKSVIDLAHKLGLKVTGEGIETAMQHEFLKANDCDYGQGYLFSRPLSASDLEAVLMRSKI